MEGEPEPEATLFPATVGEKLRAAREAQGLELSEIAANTRIPQRHLDAIEKSQYASLPSITYAVGFAKAYARAVGADEVAIAREVRGELGGTTTYERSAPVPSYDLGDTRRNAPSGLVWVGLLVAVIVLAGVGIWYGTNLFRGSAPPPETLVIPEATPAADPQANDTAAVPGAGGQVALIAIDTVWLRVTDGAGKKLFEEEMQPGERYEVPQDADRPRARTARPDKVQVTLNGSNVPPLGEGAVTVDVEVSADALRARGQPGAAPTPAATPAPAATRQPRAARPTPRPTPTPQPVTPAAAPAGNATAP
jgi:transcriptional regulator with XRE-family HTH domain